MNRDVYAYFRLRTPLFDQMTALLGAHTETARADLLDVDRNSLRRVRRGAPIGTLGAYLVSKLAQHADTLAEHGLHPTVGTLIEVVEVPTGRRAKSGRAA